MNNDGPALAPAPQIHFRAEGAPQLLFNVGFFGRAAAGSRRTPTLAHQSLHQLFRLAHRQAALEHRLGRGGLCLRRRQCQQCPGVPFAQIPASQRLTHRGRKLEQSQRVADAGPALADVPGHLVVRQAEVLDELPITLGRLERIEVLALEVLDQRQLETLTLVRQTDDHRDRRQAGQARRLQAALAGDEKVSAAVGRRRDEQRLQHAVLANRGGQFVQLPARDFTPRLPWVGADLVHGYRLRRALAAGRLRPAGNQRV